MSSAPRSQCLLRFISGTVNDQRIFTCPANFVTLVKSAYITNGTAAEALLYLRLTSPDSSTNMDIERLSVPAGEVASWQGWAAINAGDRLTAICSVANCGVWISGAVLSGAAQFPPLVRELPQQLPGNAGPEPRSGGQSAPGRQSSMSPGIPPL